MEIDLVTSLESQIQLSNIEAELKSLWDKQQGKDKIWAALFNLIVYTKKDKRDAYYQNIIHSVVSKFPCRVIWITAENSSENYLRTSVHFETVKEGELQIFCEILHIEVAGQFQERVPFIILPHILPDLPLYLLWTEDPSKENAILPHLEPYASRIIFDSESMTSMNQFGRAMLSLTERFHCEIGDLNWSALNGWRKIINETFDTPEKLKALTQLKRLSIGYNKKIEESDKHSEIEAAYLQGWIAAQLKWQLHSLESAQDHYKLTYEGPVSVTLMQEEIDELPGGAITFVEMESSYKSAHFSFKRHPEVRQVFMQCSDENSCDLPLVFFLSGALPGQEIIEEIFYQKPSHHYRNMLQLLSITPWDKKR